MRSNRGWVVVFGLVLAPWCAAAPSYQLSLLSSLGGSFGSAYDINDAGRIVGYSNLVDDADGNPRSHAAYWASRSAAALDLAPALGDSVASRINDRGRIIGSPTPFYPQGLPGTLLWQSAGATPGFLAPLPDYTGQAVAINNAGKMAGSSQDMNLGSRATTWNPAEPLDGDGTAAYDINEAGAIAGTTQDDGGRAVIWQGGGRTTLGAVAGAIGAPLSVAINDPGRVAGTSLTVRGQQFHNEATVWNGGVASLLAVPAGADSGVADLNNRGQIVGWFSSRPDRADQVAALWDGAAAIDLNSFVSLSQREAGWALTGAAAINEHGDIVGHAVNRALGQTTGFVLSVSPVPEPATVVSMLSGLALLGLLLRRRRANAPRRGLLSAAAG